jgi:hypothetical protein
VGRADALALCRNIDLERTPSSTRAARLRYTLEKAEIGAIILRIPLTTIYSEPLSITSRASSLVRRCALRGVGAAGVSRIKVGRGAPGQGPLGPTARNVARRTLHVARCMLHVARCMSHVGCCGRSGAVHVGAQRLETSQLDGPSRMQWARCNAERTALCWINQCSLNVALLTNKEWDEAQTEASALAAKVQRLSRLDTKCNTDARRGAHAACSATRGPAHAACACRFTRYRRSPRSSRR